MTKISNQYSLTNVLFADTTNGRVGIGTASPAYALQVSAATGTNVTPQINAVNTTTNGYGILRLTGASRGGIIDFYDNATAQTSISGQGGVLSFYTNGDSSGTPKVTITSAGNVGIGTSSPVWLLEINKDTTSGATGGYPAISVNNPNAAGYTGYYFYSGTTQKGGIEYSNSTNAFSFYANSAERMRIGSNGDIGIGTAPQSGGSGGRWLTIDGTGFGYSGGLIFTIAAAAKCYMYTDTDSYFTIQSTASQGVKFLTNNTEKMRILSNGNVGIGVTNPTYKLEVNGEFLSKGAATAAYSYEDRNNTSLVYTMFAYAGYTNFYNGGNKAQINMSNGAYTALSDINKKKDFEPSNIGLNEVLQLKPTLYRMKTDDESSSKELGFIAQEVKEYIPQAYTESGEGDKKFIGLNQMPLIAALTKAIQELSADLTSAKQEIELLKAK